MAGKRGGGGRSRLEMRKQHDAAEAREADTEEEVEDEEEGDEEEGDEEEGDEEGEASDSGEEGEPADYDDEDAPKPKKKPKKAPAEKKPKRVKAVKVVRMKAIWVVFDNSGKRVGTFAFPQKAEAEALMAAKIEEKKTTFYIQLIKEPLEE